MSTKISELSALSGSIPATNAVPISVSGTTYRVNLGDLAELNGSADVKAALGAADQQELAELVVDGVALGSVIPVTTVTASGNGAFANLYPAGGNLSGEIGGTANKWYQGNFHYVIIGYRIDLPEILFNGGSYLGGVSNALYQRNGTNPQAYELYGTYTSSTNYERLSTKYNSGTGTFQIGTEKGSGGGSARSLSILTDGSVRATFSGNGVTATTFNGDYLVLSNTSYLQSTAAGRILLDSNSSPGSFDRLQFGGTTSSFPAIKRNAAGIDIRLADDSAYAPIAASSFVTTSDSINAQTGTTYTLLSTDNGKIVKLTNASAITVTVPAGLTIGFSCQIVQGGAGDVTLSASSTTINSYGSLLTLAGQYASASIFSDATDVFLLAGNLK